MYVCAKCVGFAYLYDLSVGFLNSSYGVMFYYFHFIYDISSVL